MEYTFKSKWGDFLTGIVILALGVIGFVGSYSIKVAPGAGNISAQIMPRIISAIMAVLGLILTIKGCITGIHLTQNQKTAQP